jgi:RecA-family ATPase
MGTPPTSIGKKTATSMKFEKTSLQDLIEYNKENPVEYLVDELFTQFTFNLIVGSPKSGKSTFARQLMACVTTGEDFLGRRVVHPGQAYYIRPDEPNGCKVAQDLQDLGLKSSEIFMQINPRVDTGTFTKDLDEFLKEHPEIDLVVLDTLQSCLGIEDLDKYTDVESDVRQLAYIAHERKATIVALHHTNKKGYRSVNSAVNGSNALTSKSDTSVLILGEDPDPRTIKTLQKDGYSLEETELNFMVSTKRLSLGRALSEIADEDKQERKDNFQRDVLQILTRHPDGMTKTDLVGAAGGNNQITHNRVQKMIDDRVIERKTVSVGKRKKELLFPANVIPTETDVTLQKAA